MDLPISVAGASILSREFKRALENAEPTTYIERPKSLEKLTKRRRLAVTGLKTARKESETEIMERANKISKVWPEIPQVTALDYAVKSIFLETDLARRGAVYGDKPWNFCLTPIRVARSDLELIKQIAVLGLDTIISCLPNSKGQFSLTEQYLNSLNLKPNCARVDILLTNNGPKIIEVNANWVDAIQALSTFEFLTGGKLKNIPVRTLYESLAPNYGLAIVNIAAGKGSRAAGPQNEMEALANNIKSLFDFLNVEVIDPNKIRAEYLKNFDGFYLNGDPRMIGSRDIPDWVQVIFDRVKNKSARVLPNWSPQYDRKQLMIEASIRSNDFMPTLPFNKANLFGQSTYILKGESFSSQKVAFSNSENFDQLKTDASMFPNDYTVQEAAVIKPLPEVLAFDTSACEPVFIPNPNYKFNVWVIGGACVGIMVSISPDKTISDKDYNAIPIPV